MTGASPQRARARLSGADGLRALATVLVVVIHTSHWPPRATVFDDADLLSRVAVPAFMVLTGVLLAYHHRGARPETRQFLRLRFSRSVLPWLAWAPVYVATGWLITGNVPHSAGDVVSFLSWGAGHLWFLLLIPQMYLLFLVWPRQRVALAAIAALVLQTLLAVARLYAPMPSPLIEQLTLWHGFQLFPFWIGYFGVGVLAGRHLARHGEPAAPRRARVLGLSAAVLVSGWLLVAVQHAGAPHGAFAQGTGGFLLPQEPLYVVAVAALVGETAPWLLRRSHATAALTRLLSDNSLGVYILHPLVVYAIATHLGPLLERSLPQSLLGFAVLTVGGLAGATVLSMLLAGTPLAPTLGVRRRQVRGPSAADARASRLA